MSFRVGEEHNSGMDHALAGLVGFARGLRHSGMTCGPDRVQAFLAAVEEVGVEDREGVYWAGRLTLCSDPDDLARFDAAFECWFGDAELPKPAAPVPVPRPARIAALSQPDEDADEEAESDPLSVAASREEVLRQRDVSELGEQEREHLRRLLATLRPDPPPRPSVRYRRSRRGSLDPRETLREMLRAGGEPVRMRQDRKSVV